MGIWHNAVYLFCLKYYSWFIIFPGANDMRGTFYVFLSNCLIPLTDVSSCSWSQPNNQTPPAAIYVFLFLLSPLQLFFFLLLKRTLGTLPFSSFCHKLYNPVKIPRLKQKAQEKVTLSSRNFNILQKHMWTVAVAVKFSSNIFTRVTSVPHNQAYGATSIRSLSLAV